MTHWDELERDLRLSVHPTFADKLLDNALESDNMLGAYGEIADLVATLRAPATAAELGSQADAVAEMSKLLRGGPGGSAPGVVMASKKAMAVAAAAASLATGSAFAAGLPAAVQDIAATVSGALVGLVDGGSEQSVAEAQAPAAPETAPPAEQQRSPEQTPLVEAAAANAETETEAPPTPEQGEAVAIEYDPPADAPDAPEPAREPRAREAALPVGAGTGPLNPDDAPFEPPAAGGDDVPAPPAEEPPVLTPEGPPSGPPPAGSGADFQAPAPFVPPFVPVDDENDGSAAPAPTGDTGSDQQGDGNAGGVEQNDDQGGSGDGQGSDDQGADQGGQGDDGQGDGGSSGGDNGGGDPGQSGGGGDGGQGCQSDGSGNANGNGDANGNGNANGHCKNEDGDDHNHGGGNG